MLENSDTMKIQKECVTQKARFINRYFKDNLKLGSIFSEYRCKGLYTDTLKLSMV